MKRALPFLYIFTIVLSQFSTAQVDLKWYYGIPVEKDGNYLRNPWAGGLDAAQFSEIDLNFDGLMDLFIFDRAGNALLTFLNIGSPDNTRYEYAPKYQSKFRSFHDWALTVDYNCDGKKDIYTSAGNGITVYRNDSDPYQGLKFTMVDTLVYSKGYSYANLYISKLDIPGLTDIDNDGDIDVLTFPVMGTAVKYHQNLSMDSFGHCDSLLYQVASYCWGSFVEDPANCTADTITCKTGKRNSVIGSKKNMDAGSSILAIDLDGDTDKDFIFGHVNCNNLTSLINGGNTTFAQMTIIDSLFPSNTLPAKMDNFPASYYIDVNNDNIRDLIVSPNTFNGANYKSIFRYQNDGTDDSPVFTYQQDDFLQNEMIEVGECSNPVFFDYNNDGLLDLVIGNYGYYKSQGGYEGKLKLFENVGTIEVPYFKLISEDYGNLSAYNLNGLYPAFGDLDNDQDMDLMIGDYEGYLHYFKNVAPSGQPALFSLNEPYFDSIDVGHFAAPQLFDVNRDGKLDLLIGNKSGKISYYQDTGLIGAPEFKRITDNFGLLNVKHQYEQDGYSAPFMTVLDTSGNYYLLSGSYSGNIHLYGGIDGNLDTGFILIDSVLSGIDLGARSTISGADINNDGYLDFALGNERGGVMIYTASDTFIVPEVFTPNISRESGIDVFPNPAGDILHFQCKSCDSKTIGIEIFDLLGRNIRPFKLHPYSVNKKILSIDINNIPTGFYIIRLIYDDNIVSKSLIKI